MSNLQQSVTLGNKSRGCLVRLTGMCDIYSCFDNLFVVNGLAINSAITIQILITDLGLFLCNVVRRS